MATMPAPRNIVTAVGPDRSPAAPAGRAPLARLLGLLMGVISDQLQSQLRDAGFDDQRPAHNAVFANIPAEGIRLTDLAERAGMSKQAMGELVADLENLGYLRRGPDPSDGRARLIQLTDRGWQAISVALRAFDRIESDLAKRIGRQRMKEFRKTLTDLTQP
jgi:DNA-binding MarR family transcriptional regulator